MSNVMEIIVRAVDQASNVLNNIGKQGEQATKNLEKSFKNAGKAMSDTGKSLSKNVTAPLVGVGVLATKASIDLETAFTGVIKTVDATEQELRELKQGFETMAKTVPIATTELYGIGEAAGQLGIKKENILGFSDVMAKLGVTTNMSSDQAATALARLANITQMPQTEFDRLGATIVALGNNLATTEAEIVEMGLRIAGAGSQVGLTEAQILSFAGALSSVGIEAESGGSAISRVMVDMANAVASGGQKLEQFAQVSGMSASQFQQAFEKDAAGAIISFIEGLDKTAKSGGNVFAVLEDLGLSEIRVRDALLRAAGAGDLFRESLELGSKAWVENNALNKEAELRFETTASKIQLFKNQLQLTANTFGEALLPVISKALEGITPLIQRFSELSDGTKRTIFVIAGLAAAVGPVLIILGKVVGAVGTLIGTFSKLKTAWAAVTTVSNLFNASLLANPITWVIAGIMALIAVIVLLWKNWDEVSEWLAESWEWIKEKATAIFESLAEFFSAVWEGIKEVSIAVWEVITEFLSSIWEGIKDVATAVWESISEFMSGIWEGMKEIASTVFGALADFFSSIWETIKQTFITVLEAIKNVVSTVWEGIKTLTSTVWEGIKGSISSITESIKSVISSVFNAIKSIISSIWNSVKSVTSSVWNGIKSVMTNIINGIRNVVSSSFNNIKNIITSVWNGVKNVTQSIWNSMIGIVKAPINSIIGLINGMIGALNRVKINIPKVPDWIPGIGGRGGGSIGFNIPTVPYLARGGFIKGGNPTPAVIGEGRYDEAVIPLNESVLGKLAEMIASRMNLVGPEADIPLSKTFLNKFTAPTPVPRDITINVNLENGKTLARVVYPYLETMLAEEERLRTREEGRV